MIRVVLYGSGSPVSVAALRALAPVADVVAVVAPAGGRIRGPRSFLRSVSRRRAQRALLRAARRLRVPVLRAQKGPDRALEAALRSLEPDLICVATFPYLLPASALAIPRRGALGLHPSLLPRHRGPSPLFWTYFHDDAEAGVTVFWMDAGEDTGDVVFQERVPLARGRTGPDLYDEIAARGSALLARAVAAVQAGTAPRAAQDAARATREPAREAEGWRVDFQTWSAERVWHLLRGIQPRGGVLPDAAGRPTLHGPVRGYRLEPGVRPPGELERTAFGWRLHCRDGVVELGRASLSRRAWWAARRALPSRRRPAAAERTGTRSSA